MLNIDLIKYKGEYMHSSYYITEIEKKLTKLGVNVNTDQAYNQIFNEKDDTKFLRRLRSFNSLLDHQIDILKGEKQSE